tara:strand:- start:2159 stop:3199 length:1041 start_codon:yes stop_codon:yes gene_type:complete
MRKVLIASAGGYDKLTLQESSDPECHGSDDVLIDVSYSGINYADVLVRMGVYESAKEYVGWPITPGFEVSGRVSQVGNKVEQFQVGDQVIGFTLFNGYSSRLCLPQNQVIKLPEYFTLEQGSCFIAAHMTAYYALYQIFNLPPESLLLVHSAAGGVGSALVNLATARGHRVVGVVGNPVKKEYVNRLGAIDVFARGDQGFDYRQIRQKYGNNFDAVFDANGYTTLRFSYEVLKATGRLVSYGSHNLLPKEGGKLSYLKAAFGLLKTPHFNPLDLITDNKALVGFNLSFLFEYELLKTDCLNGLMSMVNDKQIPPPKVRVFAVEDVANAHQWLESGESMGKLALCFK